MIVRHCICITTELGQQGGEREEQRQRPPTGVSSLYPLVWWTNCHCTPLHCSSKLHSIALFVHETFYLQTRKKISHPLSLSLQLWYFSVMIAQTDQKLEQDQVSCVKHVLTCVYLPFCHLNYSKKIMTVRYFRLVNPCKSSV